jgi:NADH-quinone oxidoreductase subunit G
MEANVSVSEAKPPQDDDSPLAFTMEGYKGIAPPSLVPYYWSPGWNSAHAMNKYLDEPDGSNQGGNPGVLLFNEKNGLSLDFYKNIPGIFTPDPGKFLVVPLFLIFGSEELSSISKPLSELIPEPFVLINEKEIKTLRITENNMIKLVVGQISICKN